MQNNINGSCGTKTALRAKKDHVKNSSHLYIRDRKLSSPVMGIPLTYTLLCCCVINVIQSYTLNTIEEANFHNAPRNIEVVQPY